MRRRRAGGSHDLAETEKTVQLMRGIHVDAGDDIDQTVLAQAVRIARHLYPKACLSEASAVLLGPTTDGRLYITGQRVQCTRLRALEIIQNKAPAKPSVASAVVAQSMGEFPVTVSALRQRFLEAFRMRSEHAASIDAAMRDAIAVHLSEEYGDPKAASDAARALARENDWYKEGEGTQKFLLRRRAAAPARNEAAFDLAFAWRGCPSARTHTTASSGAGRRPKRGPNYCLSCGRPYRAGCRPSSCLCCAKAVSNRS